MRTGPTWASPSAEGVKWIATGQNGEFAHLRSSAPLHKRDLFLAIFSTITCRNLGTGDRSWSRSTSAVPCQLWLLFGFFNAVRKRGGEELALD